MTTNGGTHDSGSGHEPDLNMDAISWGEIRKYQRLTRTDPDAAQDRFDELLERVCPGINELPMLRAVTVIRRFNQAIEDGMSGKDQPPAPS
jgi:hypothetical protein